MNEHPVRWIAPQPLWGRFAAAGQAAGSASALHADDQYRPALLRFASDDFMPQVLALLARDPAQLGGYIARPETWRNPQPDGADLMAQARLPQPAQQLQRLKAARTPRGVVERSAVDATDPREKSLGLPAPRTLPLKLYQPVHQRHYLVAAGLVCGVAGLPERALATGGREQVGFVLRRLLPTSQEECAYVKGATGARWQRTGTPASAETAKLVAGEEMLPLFSMSFSDDAGRPRRLLAGTIPVGRRDEYMGLRIESAAAAPAGTPAPPVSTVAARKEQFKSEIAEPWKNLVRSAVKVQLAAAGLPPNTAPTPAQRQASRIAANLQLQAQSWLILLDFADYLAVHLPAVWTALLGAPDGSRVLPDAAANALYQAIGHASMGTFVTAALAEAAPGGAVKTSLGAALVAIRDNDGATTTRVRLESTTAAYKGTAGTDWPTFNFLLAGVGTNDVAAGPFTAFTQPARATTSTVDGGFAGVEDEDAVGASAATSQAVAMQLAADRLDGLVKLVVGALPAGPEQDGKAPPIPFAAKLQRDAIAANVQNDPGTFVIRCVFQRCDCGPLHADLLSRPSQQFQLAGFFDPDAPARPIRIQLPLDTTPAGLRKFNRNTAFQISDVLCGQMSRAKGLGLGDLVLSVLPWPFHKDLSIDVGDMGPCTSGGMNVGMICSLSIPIITICAFILLMMIVLVLDIVFRWIPYFVICFPLPGFKAKKGS